MAMIGSYLIMTYFISFQIDMAESIHMLFLIENDCRYGNESEERIKDKNKDVVVSKYSLNDELPSAALGSDKYQ